MSRDEVLEAILTLERVRDYARGDRADAPEVPYLTVSQQSRLQEVTGQAAAMLWASTFSATLARFNAFKQQLVETPNSVSVDELEEAASACARTFEGLGLWLDARPVAQAAS